MPFTERKISWRVTRFCNLHCVHCLAGHGNAVRRDLSSDERVALLRTLFATRLTRITWTGGEPTLCNDLPTLLQMTHDAGVASVVTTHGLALRNQIWQALDPSLDRLRISFDGLQSTHDAIRGGAFFARTLAALDEAKARGVHVEVNITVFKHNVGEIPELVELLALHGVFRFVLLTLTRRESAVDNELACATESELTRLRARLRQVTQARSGLSIQLNSYSEAGDTYVVIESDGEILLCSEQTDDISYGSAVGVDAATRVEAALAAQTLAHRGVIAATPRSAGEWMVAEEVEVLPAKAQDGSIVARDRREVHRDGTEHFAVHVLCTSGARVSLQRRGSQPRRNPHAWTSTGSGHVDVEDCAVDRPLQVDVDVARRAATRELGEELRSIGVFRELAPPNALEFVGAGPASSISADELERCNAHAFVFVLELPEQLPDVDRRDTLAQPVEVEALRSFRIEDVDRAVLQAAPLEGYRFADNFHTVWAIARSALLARL